MTESTLVTTRPEEAGLSAARLDRIRDVLQREVEAGRLPGAVAFVGRHGRVAWTTTLGAADPASGRAMAEDAIFRVYSMTKPIVSLIVMMLAEEGRLLLTDPLDAYIPAFADMKVAVERDGGLDLVRAARPITIHDLLRHTSGLTYEFTGEGPVQRMYRDADLPSRARTNAEHVAALAEMPLLNHPGTHWDYSRSTDVLGRVIEVIEGRALSQSLRARVLDPLDMRDTAFQVAPEAEARIAQAFARDPDTGEPIRLYDPREVPAFQSGGGGLVSTAADYARFLRMLVGGGTLEGARLVSPATLRFMTADHLGPEVVISPGLLPPGHGFGLGFAVRRSAGLAPNPGSPGAYFWGGIAGTTFWIDPELRLFALLLIQAPGRRDYFRGLFRNLVYAAVED